MHLYALPNPVEPSSISYPSMMQRVESYVLRQGAAKVTERRGDANLEKLFKDGCLLSTLYRVCVAHLPPQFNCASYERLCSFLYGRALTELGLNPALWIPDDADPIGTLMTMHHTVMCVIFGYTAVCLQADSSAYVEALGSYQVIGAKLLDDKVFTKTLIEQAKWVNPDKLFDA